MAVTKVQGFFDLIECYFQTSFHNSVNKMIHEIRHNNENPFSCSQYDSKFANPTELKIRENWHLNEKPIQLHSM